MFFLLLISQHEMRWLVLMVNDVNGFTGSHHQYQTIILKRLKRWSSERNAKLV